MFTLSYPVFGLDSTEFAFPCNHRGHRSSLWPHRVCWSRRPGSRPPKRGWHTRRVVGTVVDGIRRWRVRVHRPLDGGPSVWHTFYDSHDTTPLGRGPVSTLPKQWSSSLYSSEWPVSFCLKTVWWHRSVCPLWGIIVKLTYLLSRVRIQHVRCLSHLVFIKMTLMRSFRFGKILSFPKRKEDGSKGD